MERNGRTKRVAMNSSIAQKRKVKGQNGSTQY